jgi:hypothetical protein
MFKIINNLPQRRSWQGEDHGVIKKGCVLFVLLISGYFAIFMFVNLINKNIGEIF